MEEWMSFVSDFLSFLSLLQDVFNPDPWLKLQHWFPGRDSDVAVSSIWLVDTVKASYFLVDSHQFQQLEWQLSPADLSAGANYHKSSELAKV